MGEELKEIILTEATQKRIRTIQEEANKQIVNIMQIVIAQNGDDGNWKLVPDCTKLIKD
jgi:hypothetical protein